jgi:Domain of unknown function (DUF397)
MTDTTPAIRWEGEFRKSSFSGSNGGNCVEVTRSSAAFGVRDSKDPIGPVLGVTAEQGHTFLLAIKGDYVVE